MVFSFIIAGAEVFVVVELVVEPDVFIAGATVGVISSETSDCGTWNTTAAAEGSAVDDV